MRRVGSPRTGSPSFDLQSAGLQATGDRCFPLKHLTPLRRGKRRPLFSLIAVNMLLKTHHQNINSVFNVSITAIFRVSRHLNICAKFSCEFLYCVCSSISVLSVCKKILCVFFCVRVFLLSLPHGSILAATEKWVHSLEKSCFSSTIWTVWLICHLQLGQPWSRKFLNGQSFAHMSGHPRAFVRGEMDTLVRSCVWFVAPSSLPRMDVFVCGQLRTHGTNVQWQKKIISMFGHVLVFSNTPRAIRERNVCNLCLTNRPLWVGRSTVFLLFEWKINMQVFEWKFSDNFAFKLTF